MSNEISNWTDGHLQDEYKRLTKAGWDRALKIAKERKERHVNINFDNPNFMDYLKNLEVEIEKRGLRQP